MSNFFDQLSASQQSNKEQISPPSEDIATQAEYNTPLYDSQIKATTQELLKFGLIEAQHKPKRYQICLHYQTQINTILDPLDLQIHIDDTRGLAFIAIASHEQEHSDDWQHPLVRRQRMNLEQSLMVAILRQHFLAHEQDSGTGDLKAIVHLDDLLPQLNQFLEATGSDERDNKRLRNLLEQLRTYALVSEIDDNDKITIRPLIAHLNNPEHLQSLIAELKKHRLAQQNSSATQNKDTQPQ